MLMKLFMVQTLCVCSGEVAGIMRWFSVSLTEVKALLSSFFGGNFKFNNTLLCFFALKIFDVMFQHVDLFA